MRFYSFYPIWSQEPLTEEELEELIAELLEVESKVKFFIFFPFNQKKIVVCYLTKLFTFRQQRLKRRWKRNR